MARPVSSAASLSSHAVPTAEPLLSLEDAATRGAWTPRTLREMVRRGEVPAYRIGSGPRARLRFRWSEIEAALRPVAATGGGAS
jgi:hypothetical protein